MKLEIWEIISVRIVENNTCLMYQFPIIRVEQPMKCLNLNYTNYTSEKLAVEAFYEKVKSMLIFSEQGNQDVYNKKNLSIKFRELYNETIDRYIDKYPEVMI